MHQIIFLCRTMQVMLGGGGGQFENYRIIQYNTEHAGISVVFKIKFSLQTSLANEMAAITINS